MNSYETARRQRLAELLSDPRVSYEDLLESVGQFLEESVRTAFYNGLRAQSKKPMSALRAGKLVRVNPEGRA